MGGDAFDIINKNDPRAIWEELADKWKDLLAAFGEGAVRPFLDNVIVPLTKAFSQIGQWAHLNPEAANNIMKVMAGLSALLIVSGSPAIFTAVMTTLGFVPFAAIAAGIGGVYFALTHLDQVKGWVASFSKWMDDTLGKQFAGNVLTKGQAETLGSIHAFFVSMWDGIKAGWAALPAQTNAAITAAISDIGVRISAELQRLKSYIPGFGDQLPRPQGHPGEAPGDNVQMGSLVPPPAAPPVTINNSLSVDGDALARSTTKYMR